MTESNTLDVLKQSFEKIIPAQDGRTRMTPLSFVVCLVYCYLGDSKTFSLEAIRRFTMKQTGITISRSAFWERLTTKRLREFLIGVFDLHRHRHGHGRWPCLRHYPGGRGV